MGDEGGKQMRDKERKEFYEKLEEAREAEDRVLKALMDARPLQADFCICCKATIAENGEFCRNCAKFHVRGAELPGPTLPVKRGEKLELPI